jgi:hypothetical protein
LKGGYTLIPFVDISIIHAYPDILCQDFVVNMLNIPAPLTDLGVSQDLRSALLKLAAALPDTRRSDEAKVRRRGYARQVVAAWATYVLGEGKVAFYSHEAGNVASEALARSLGVAQYAVMTNYEINATTG